MPQIAIPALSPRGTEEQGMTGDANGDQEIWPNQEIYRNSQISDYFKIPPQSDWQSGGSGFKSRQPDLLTREDSGRCIAKRRTHGVSIPWGRQTGHITPFGRGPPRSRGVDWRLTAVSSPSSPVIQPQLQSPTTPTRPTMLVTCDDTWVSRCSSVNSVAPLSKVAYVLPQLQQTGQRSAL